MISGYEYAETNYYQESGEIIASCSDPFIRPLMEIALPKQVLHSVDATDLAGTLQSQGIEVELGNAPSP